MEVRIILYYFRRFTQANSALTRKADRVGRWPGPLSVLLAGGSSCEMAAPLPEPGNRRPNQEAHRPRSTPKRDIGGLTTH